MALPYGNKSKKEFSFAKNSGMVYGLFASWENDFHSAQPQKSGIRA